MNFMNMKREFLSNTKNNTVKNSKIVHTIAVMKNFNQSDNINELIVQAKATLPNATIVMGINVRRKNSCILKSLIWILRMIDIMMVEMGAVKIPNEYDMIYECVILKMI